MSSLSARLLVSVSLLLLFFFGVTIVVLDSAFREAGEQAQEDILDGQLMSLLAAAEPNIYGELQLPPDLPEPRFSNLESGLYGELRDNNGTPAWKSRSALGLDLPYGTPPAAGSHQFSRLTLADGTPLMALSLGVEWELPNGELRPYTFSVAESLDSYYAQLARFRRQLFGWFGGVALIMLFSISLMMRGILRPLRQIETEISDVEKGRRKELSQGFPSELQGVASNMNLLIGSERARAERYRHTLDNLAHSLKTPLAAMRAVLSSGQHAEDTARIEQQIERMNDIVRYQLRKPATLASDSLGVAAFPVAPELERLVEGLSKVYLEKAPQIVLDVGGDIRFRGETGDFLELAGNLLDNACKWCERRVEIQVRSLDGASADSGHLRITVADDGPGIPADAAESLLQRGMRLDESAPGHGIGLAVVNEIAASYGGEVSIGRAALGGAKVSVTIAP
ncbi:MAG: ATP-binding protein [Gammaproteobacteria bacterium]|nr:MAG: ATP-binding protein [Gammaproteobacteria bacterium]